MTTRQAAPLITVIMIFLNGEEYMDEAIASVVAQEGMDHFELLLCDDGSYDRSTAIAQSWVARDPSRVKYLEHEDHANRGMSATRNLGIAAAEGEYIAFIDADDVWRPRKLAEQVTLMDRFPEVGMVCGTVRYWRSWAGGLDDIVPTGHVQGRVVHPPEASLALYPLGRAAAPCPSDVLVRRRAVESLGGFEEHFTGPRQAYEDQGFFAKLYLAWPVYFADEVWLDYRQHGDSIGATVGRAGQYHDVRRYFLDWFEGYLDQLPDQPPAAVRAAVARELQPYRRPRAYALSSFARRLVRKTRSGVGWLGKGLRRLGGA
ncbi:glycosyltransferase family 2 protein [Modestobacter sp. URMC 112]